MFEKKTIFSKRYPQIVNESLDEELSGNDSKKDTYQSGEDFIRHLEKDSRLVPAPERQKKKDMFIRLAVMMSKDYQIDTDIYESDGSIVVNIYIEPSLFSGELKRLFTHLIMIADDISFFIPNDNKHSLLVSLDYFTHELYLSERKVRNIS